MIFFKRLFAFSRVILVVSITNVVVGLAQENESGVDKEHLLGVVNAHIARLDSWESGDVLVRVRTSGSGKSDAPNFPEGTDVASAVFEQTALMRFVFDFPKGRFVCAICREREIRAFDAKDNEIIKKPFPDRFSFTDAFLIDERKSLAVFRDRTGRYYQLEPSVKPFIEIARERFGVLDFKGVGLAGSADSSWNETSLRTTFDMLFNSDVIETVTQVGKDRFRTFSRVSLPKLNIKGYRRTVDWDVVNCVPLGYAEYPGFDDDAQPPHNSGRVEWLELNSQMLPQVVRENNRKLLHGSSGHRFAVDQESEIDFHWFAINEQLSDEFFDERRFKEPGRIAELLSEHQFKDPTSHKKQMPLK